MSDGHHTLTNDPGVTAITTTSGQVVLTVGSGNYQLHVPSLAPSPTHRHAWPFIALIVVAIVMLSTTATTMRRRRARGARLSLGTAADR